MAKEKTTPCGTCERQMPVRDLEFWGRECFSCRAQLPLHSFNSPSGDGTRGPDHDRAYHGKNLNEDLDE